VVVTDLGSCPTPEFGICDVELSSTSARVSVETVMISELPRNVVIIKLMLQS
jgi:hypothetical protein